jgi:hypothetical protein
MGQGMPTNVGHMSAFGNNEGVFVHIANLDFEKSMGAKIQLTCVEYVCLH